MGEPAMNERDLVGNIPESTTSLLGETRELFGNIAVVTRNTGARIAWSSDHSELRVNSALFPNADQARVATLRQVGSHMGLTQAIRTDSSLLLDLTRTYSEASEPVLRWQGLARMREMNPYILHDQPVTSPNQTLSQEFQWALDAYVLTGSYPEQMSDAVRQAVSRIPQPRGRSLVDYIASGRYLRFDGQNFATYIQPLIDELAEADKQTGKSQQFEYRPTPPQDVAGSKEPIQESDITVRVAPFYGGYYREQVCRYDPATRQIVKEAGTKSTWSIDDLPEDEAFWKTKRTYEGIVQPGQEALIKLPYKALPITSTLNPPDALHFMRDDLGIISVDPRHGQTADSTTFSFDFVLTESPSNQLNIPPTDRDTVQVGGTLDPETQTLIDDLSSQAWMSDMQKAREVAIYVRKKLRYPQDKNEIAQIDSLYQSTTPEELWTKITETGVAHCYWANILRDELCKRLGIASRIITGPYVSSKDPRFELAIVEATGLPKHAWGEVWDPLKEVWTHKGMDATPPKAKDASQDQDGQSQPQEGDFGDSQLDQPALNQEEVEKLYEELSNQNESATPKTSSPEEMAAKQFEQEKGVTWREWHQLETWINKINRTPVPADASIRHRPSTIYDEYRSLFDLLLEHRAIPRQAYKGPVRQSEGDMLDDPVTAYIDVVGGDDDPSGYMMETQKEKDYTDISAFDDDWISDLSRSMKGRPREELRKMIMSSTYDLMGLDRRLQHTNNRERMRTPLHIRSTQIPFGTVAKEVMRTAVVDERKLIELDHALQESMGGSQGLRAALEAYKNGLDAETLKEIREGKRKKMLTIVSDGRVTDKPGCIALIKELRELGIITQGLGFGSAAQDIRVVCNEPADPDAVVVIDDVTQATLVRHKLLMKHLSRL